MKRADLKKEILAALAKAQEDHDAYGWDEDAYGNKHPFPMSLAALIDPIATILDAYVKAEEKSRSVYLVVFADFASFDIIGVFSTPEKAREVARTDDGNDIIEWVVDAMPENYHG